MKKKILGVAVAFALIVSLVAPNVMNASANTEKSEGIYQIGETRFATMKDAINAVQDGETIEVLDNETNAPGVSVPSGKNFTIDFQGHIYTLTGAGAGSSGTETNGFQLLKDSNIIMKDGTINVAKNPDNIKMIIQNYSNLTLEDMTIDPKNKLSAGTTHSEDYALSINNGEIHFKGDTNILASDEDVVSFDIFKFGNYPAAKVVFDNDFTGTIEGTILFDSPNGSSHNLQINGNGTFAKIKTTNEASALEGIKINSGTFKTLSPLKYLTDGSNVNVKLSENENANVVIPENASVKLDLNGKTINGGTNNGAKPAITNNGNLVIDDLSGDKTGTIKRDDNGPVGNHYVIHNLGIMTIKNGNIINNAGDGKKGSSLICNGGKKEATLNIEGGKFKQDNFIVIKNDDYGKLNITGGEITAKDPASSAIQNWSEANITGGKINGLIWTATWSDDLPDSITKLGGTVEVTGEIRAGYSGKGYGNNKTANVQINGGKYDAKFTTQTPEGQIPGKGTEITVNKGLFTNADVMKYITGGNAALFADGNYNIMPEDKAKKAAVASVMVDGEIIYITDKNDIKDIVGDDENIEVKDITDYATLESIVEEMSKLDESKYTDDSFAPVEKLLTEAKAVLEAKNSTQEEVDALVAQLTEAKAGLKDKETNKPVEPNDDDNSTTPNDDQNIDDNKDKTDKGDSEKEESDSVETGDDTAIGLLAGMLLLSGAGFVALRRKEK